MLFEMKTYLKKKKTFSCELQPPLVQCRSSSNGRVGGSKSSVLGQDSAMGLAGPCMETAAYQGLNVCVLFQIQSFFSESKC